MKNFIISLLGLFIVFAAKAQTDSIGIYAIHGFKAEKIVPLTTQQTKVSNAVIKGKVKQIFDGATSENKFTGTATLRLYFGTPSPYEIAKYFMFTPAYSAKDFRVGRFDVKKDTRRLTTATVSVVGFKTGAEAAKDITVTTTKIRENVYEITVTGPAGEYCIMPVLQGTAGYAGVFDFTLK